MDLAPQYAGILLASERTTATQPSFEFKSIWIFLELSELLLNRVWPCGGWDLQWSTPQGLWPVWWAWPLQGRFSNRTSAVTRRRVAAVEGTMMPPPPVSQCETASVSDGTNCRLYQDRLRTEF